MKQANPQICRVSKREIDLSKNSFPQYSKSLIFRFCAARIDIQYKSDRLEALFRIHNREYIRVVKHTRRRRKTFYRRRRRSKSAILAISPAVDGRAFFFIESFQDRKSPKPLQTVAVMLSHFR